MLGIFHEDTSDISWEHDDEDGDHTSGGGDLGSVEREAHAGEEEEDSRSIEPEGLERQKDHGGVKAVHGGEKVQQAGKHRIDGKKLGKN